MHLCDSRFYYRELVLLTKEHIQYKVQLLPFVKDRYFARIHETKKLHKTQLNYVIIFMYFNTN